MQDQSIQQVSPNSTALNAEHYQSFEMAKANDGILGCDDIAQIRSYAAFARAQAQAVHKSIASMSELEDVTATKAEMTETAQTFAKVSVYADQRIGEILRELPKAKNQHDVSSLPTGKTQAVKDAGLTPKTASQLEQLAANPEVVEAVIAKAEQDGRVVSRSQVLKAIKERDEARENLDSTQREVKASHMLCERMKAELDGTNEDLAEAMQAQEDAEAEVTMLKRKLESIERPEPKVIEREVEVVREVVPEETQKRMKSLEHYKNLYEKDNATLRKHLEETRKELDRAKGILNMGESTRKVQNDVEYLIAATNQYVRNYGGLTWTFEQIANVDEITREELRKAVKNLATFSSALVAGLEQM